MYKILKINWFKYRKINHRSKIIVERGGIVADQNKFHSAVQPRIQGNKSPEFYLGETWENQKHSEKKLAGLIKKEGGGAREFLQENGAAGVRVLCATQDQ
jgi:hypothetical protein